jgi:hypothetical protein
MDRPDRKPTPLRLAASWAFVLLPLGWGVVQSVVKSLPLFRRPAATASPQSGVAK